MGGTVHYLFIALEENDTSALITGCKIISGVVKFHRGDDISCYCASVSTLYTGG